MLRASTPSAVRRALGPVAALARADLFAGLPDEELALLARRMKPRTFEPGEALCRAGERGDSMFVIVDGVVDVLAPADEAAGEPAAVVAKQRWGDVVGTMALVNDEPHSATVVSTSTTLALELDHEGFGELIARRPQVLSSLSRILSRRIVRANERERRAHARGEAVALIAPPALWGALPQVVEAARAASPRGIETIEARASLDDLALVDDVIHDFGTVLVFADLGSDRLRVVLDHVDRALVIARPDADAEHLAALASEAGGAAVEIAPLGAGSAPLPVARVCEQAGWDDAPPLGRADADWLGHHVARTKLGLALGAGGAKGYAHVGALRVLEREGHEVAAVSGSSIGAIVGAYLALGMDSDEIDRTLRAAWTPENVAEMFKLSFAGKSTGLDLMTRILRETTSDATFDDVRIPLAIMAVDLDSRQPAPIREGPLWQALLAATALAGMFPPHELGGRRLVDGIALVPVPTECVIEDGADVSVAVNLISRDTLEVWPGAESEPGPPETSGSRMLDTLLEVMDLANLDNSVRHAALADVPVTPRFGPASWRDFHVADRFLEAGRLAAEEQLPALRKLVAPRRGAVQHQPGGR